MARLCHTPNTTLEKPQGLCGVMANAQIILSAKPGQLLLPQPSQETEITPVYRCSNTTGEHTVATGMMENFLSDALQSASAIDFKYLIMQILERQDSKKKKKSLRLKEPVIKSPRLKC